MSPDRPPPAQVQIGRDEASGRPSIKINGVEQNMLIGPEVSLEWIEDAFSGHWRLNLCYIDPEVEIDVDAEVT